MPRLVLCVRKHSAAVSKQNPFDFHKHNLLSAELLVKESRFTDSEEQNQGGPWSGRARLPHRVRVGGSCKPGSEGAPANSCVSLNLRTSPSCVPWAQVHPGAAEVQESSFRWAQLAGRRGHCLPPGCPAGVGGGPWAKAGHALTLEKSLGPSASQWED